MVNKGDIGSLVGGLILGGAAVATGLSAPYVVGATVVGAIGGHHLTDSNHYKSVHQYKQRGIKC